MATAIVSNHKNLVLGGVFGGAAAVFIYALFALLSLFNGQGFIDVFTHSAPSYTQILSADVSPHKGAHSSRHHGDNTHADHSSDPLNETLHKSMQTSSLPPAPFPDLVEETEYGPLPQKSHNNLTPFNAYKKKASLPLDGSPVIAIGISGIGFSKNLYTQVFKTLPPNLSLIISPYVENLDHLQKEARIAGFETWLNLPIQNENFPFEDPGNYGFLSDLSISENTKNFHAALSSTTGYAGIAAYTDNTFQLRPIILNSLTKESIERGLGYLEINPSSQSAVRNIYVESGAPYIQSNLAIQNHNTAQIFQSLKQIARDKGRASGIIELTPATLRDLNAEISKAEQEGFTFVPISAFENTL